MYIILDRFVKQAHLKESKNKLIQKLKLIFFHIFKFLIGGFYGLWI